jgi:hypothetical protein
MPLVAPQKFGDRTDLIPNGRLRLQQFERFGVAAALEEMAELGIDGRRELLFELLDPFGDGFQAFGMAGGIAAAGFVGDDGEAFAEGGGEGG